jgi:hypothetical protein
MYVCMYVAHREKQNEAQSFTQNTTYLVHLTNKYGLSTLITTALLVLTSIINPFTATQDTGVYMISAMGW